MLLQGSYTHKLDAKGRIVLPARFRDELGDHVVAALVGSSYISVYPKSEWEITVSRLTEASMSNHEVSAFRRAIIASAHSMEIDSMGRILLPQQLRSRVNIVQDVSVNGNVEKLEIWDLGVWNEFVSEMYPIPNEVTRLIPGL
ncbi:MAG: division/cell wall cluster transcriptional repressor MraZ [Synergistaceae bacterium]|jgi:MraZ protein|nr:division/cell wall cluster transcriptional repressor MraZ [Synergistaceae bacterium]